MTLETIAIDELQAHPRNYRGHPAEQIAHLKASLAEYGIVKNIVVASDNVILAGHGLVQAAREAGYKELPVCRIAMPSTDPKAQKFMVLDNEISRKSEDDADQLAALLKELQDSQDLTGTGYDSDEVTQLLNDLQAEEFAQVVDLPDLASGDRDPFQQMTFTLHDEQAETIKEAISAAKDEGPFVDEANENSNGNALARICERFLSWAELKTS